jgi:hypothetical protein
MANAYEVRQQLRKLRRQQYSREKKEVDAIGRNAVEARYREAFKLVFGTEPKLLKPISSRNLIKRANELFAKAHEEALCPEGLRSE